MLYATKTFNNVSTINEFLRPCRKIRYILQYIRFTKTDITQKSDPSVLLFGGLCAFKSHQDGEVYKAGTSQARNPSLTSTSLA